MHKFYISSVVAILIEVYTLYRRYYISFFTIQHDAQYSTNTTQLSANMKIKDTRTTIQLRAQQQIIRVMTWGNFYLILIRSNPTYQCENLYFKFTYSCLQ